MKVWNIFAWTCAGQIVLFVCCVCRLQFLDVYQPAESQPEPDREFTMTLPTKTSYKDIHGNIHGKESFPNVNRARVDEYLAQYDKKLDTKIKDLYNER